MSNELTTQEALVLEAAGELLRVSRGPIRFLDVVTQALAHHTKDERILRAWQTFERETNRMGYADDPHLYCAACKGEGELADGAGRLETCVPCEGYGFLGERKEPAKLAPLYQPGDELLEAF